jgi:hypothetical protein
LNTNQISQIDFWGKAFRRNKIKNTNQGQNIVENRDLFWTQQAENELPLPAPAWMT